MKYCTNCGAKLGENDNYCMNCGKKILKEENKNEERKNAEVKQEIVSNNKVDANNTKNDISIAKQQVEQKNSNMYAIIGFCLSITNLFTCGIPSIISLILSIVGLEKSKKENTDGRGLSIAGIVISGVYIFILLMVLLIMTVFTQEIPKDILY